MSRLLTVLFFLLALTVPAHAVVFPLSPEIPGNGWDDDNNGQVDEAVAESISEDPYASGSYQLNFASCGKLVFANVSDSAFYGGTVVDKASGRSFYDGAIVCTGTMAAGKYYLHLSYAAPAGPRGLWWQTGGNFGPSLNNAQASVMATATTPRWQQIVSTGSAENFKNNTNGGAVVSFQHTGGLFILVFKAQSNLKLGCGYLTPLTTGVTPLCPGEAPAIPPTPNYTVLELGTNTIPTAWNSAAFTNANVMQFTGTVDPAVCGGALTVKMLWRNAATDRRYISINCADTDAQTVTTTNDLASFTTSAEDKVDLRWTLSTSQVCNASAFILIGNLQPARYDGDCTTGNFTATRNLNTTIVRNIVSSTSWNIFIAHDLGSNVAADTLGLFNLALTDKDAATTATSLFHGNSMTSMSQWGVVKYAVNVVPPAGDVVPPSVTSTTIPDATVTSSSMVVTANTDEQGTCRVHYGTSTGSYTLQTAGSTSVNGVCNESMLNLDAGVPYYAQMRVTDAAGNTGSSAEVTKTTLGSALTDYFSRADGALGANWAGNYTDSSNGTIVGFVVRHTALNANMLQTWIGSAIGNDQSAQTRLATWTGTAYHDAQILLRFTDSPTVTGYAVAAATTNPDYTIAVFRVDDSQWTRVAQNSAATWQQGDVLRAAAVGSTIAVYRNNDTTPLLTYVDPSPIASGRTGIGGYIEPGGALTDMELDDFYITPASPPAGGPAYYVDGTNGLDSNDCESAKAPANAKQTINAGIGCMSGGDTLLIRAGTYAMPSSSPPSGSSWTSATTIKAYTGEAPVITMTGSGWNIGDNKSYVILDGITFEGTAVTDQIIRFGAGAHHMRVINSTIYGDTGASGTPFGIMDGSGNLGNNEIANNTIHSIGQNLFTHHGMYFGSPSNLFENNEIYNVSGSCLQIYTGDQNNAGNNIVRNNICRDSATNDSPTANSGFVVWNGSGNQVYNNTISNYSGSAVSVSYGDNAKIFSNTIYRVGITAIFLSNGSGHEVKNNIFWDTCYGDATCGDWGFHIAVDSTSATKSTNLCDVSETGCSVTTDPLFVNAASNNFHLQSGSPAIGAGVDLSSVFTTDKDGVTRGAAWDIGAYEYVP